MAERDGELTTPATKSNNKRQSNATRKGKIERREERKREGGREEGVEGGRKEGCKNVAKGFG